MKKNKERRKKLKQEDRKDLLKQSHDFSQIKDSAIDSSLIEANEEKLIRSKEKSQRIISALPLFVSLENELKKQEHDVPKSIAVMNIKTLKAGVKQEHQYLFIYFIKKYQDK